MKMLALLTLAMALASCSDARRDAPAPQVAARGTVAAPAAAPDAGTHELGRRIYNFRCYFCHGYSGDAKTLAATYLNPRPRDFHATSADTLSRASMLDSIKNGRPGTAMRGFEGILQPFEMAAVTDFVRREFMIDKAPNTRYHTLENGWADHARYAAAFPFATGEMMLDAPVEKMTPEQRAGRRLFMSSCISCHDRANVSDAGAPWESRPLSYPRNGFAPGDDTVKPDAMTSATPYHLHDKAPELSAPSARELRGEALFQQNCSFCHAADGTGRNWIGSFLEPHPRDLTAPANMSGMTRERLTGVIREGLPGTSMPAWKSVLNSADIEAVADYVGRAFHPLAASQAARP